MSGSRFARSGGRCSLRFFVGLGILVLMFGMIAIFHSFQSQIEELRDQRMRCKQEQEGLNERIQSIVEQKFKLGKNCEHERNEQMETRRNLEQKLKEQSEMHDKEQMDTRVRYDKLQQTHKVLQSQHNDLVNECSKTKKQHLEDTNALQKKLQSVRSEMQKENRVQAGELTMWKEKYNLILHEKDRLEGLLNSADAKTALQSRIVDLERLVSDYQTHCDYKPKKDGSQQQINKPLNPPDTTHNASPQPMSFDKPRNEKSFAEQVRVSPGDYRIVVNETNTKQNDVVHVVNDVQNVATKNSLKNPSPPTGSSKLNGGGSGGDVVAAASLNLEKFQNLLPYSARNNRSLIINSVENFQIVPKTIKKLSEETETQLKQQPADDSRPVSGGNAKAVVSPLSAPRKPTSTEATKSEQQGHLKQAVNSSATASSSSNNLPPLPLPPNQRKLPENVAPIPANFEDLLQQEPSNRREGRENGGEAPDIDAAVEDMQKNEGGANDDGNNNRYANVVNEQKAAGAKVVANEDSGAHEIKDHDFMNDQNFNVPPEEDNNFFDGGGAKNDMAGEAKKLKDEDNEDDDMMGAGGAGDIAVKNHNHLLDADNLNNEVAADGGKEFPDGLRLEDGNDEDEDEDDYSNPGARQQGEQAIRN